LSEDAKGSIKLGDLVEAILSAKMLIKESAEAKILYDAIKLAEIGIACREVTANKDFIEKELRVIAKNINPVNYNYTFAKYIAATRYNIDNVAAELKEAVKCKVSSGEFREISSIIDSLINILKKDPKFAYLDTRITHLAFMPRFVDEGGSEDTTHELVGHITPVEAERILKPYQEMLDAEMQKAGKTLTDINAEAIANERGSVSMYLVPSGVDDKELLRIMDRASDKYKKKGPGKYTVRTTVLAIDSPRTAQNIQELYFALLAMNVPVTEDSQLRNSVARSGWKDAIKTAAEARDEKRAAKFIEKRMKSLK
jgi:hypothetical protein